MNSSGFFKSCIFINCVLLFFAPIVYARESGTLLEELVSQNQEMIARLEKVEDELQQEKRTNAVLRDKVDRLEARVVQDEEALQRVLSTNRSRRQLNDATCAFTAVITPSDLTHIQAGQTVIFDRTITNMANAYDTSTGVFTAPIRGVYILNMDILVEPGENEYLEFVKDGAHLLYNFIHASGGLDDVSSSRSVVVELEGGNQVWIRTTKSATHGSGTLHGNEFSTFSGWLLAITE